MIKIVGYLLLGALLGAVLGALLGGGLGLALAGTEDGGSGRVLVFTALGLWFGSTVMALGGAVFGFIRYRRELEE